MDYATRKKYKAWQRKRIIKRVIIPGILLLSFWIFTPFILITAESTLNSLQSFKTGQAISYAFNFDNEQKQTLENPSIEASTIILIDECENLLTDSIDAVLERYGNSVAIYYENLKTGCTFTHRAEQEFFGASITKAPYSLWLYTKAERGEIDLEEILTYSEADYLWGSGIIRDQYSFGHQFTINRLLELNLSESDNIATQMLQRRFHQEGYKDFIASLGGRRDFVGDILGSRLNANEAGLFAREIYKYIQSDGQYSQTFKQNLINNQFPFITADYPVASKTGWYHRYGGAWHDMSIIFAPSPYILVILSSDKTGTDEDHATFQLISRAFAEFNDKNFPFFPPLE